MKIIYYIPSLYIPGGLERIITFKANYFADNFENYTVIILTSEQNGNPPYYKLSNKIKLIDIGVSFDTPFNQSKLKKIVKYPFKYFLFKKRFSKILLDEHPDITISTLRRELNFLNSINDGSIKIGEFHVTRNSYHANALYSKGVLMKFIKKIGESFFIRNLKKLSRVIVLTHEESTFWPELSNISVIPNALPFFPEDTSDCSSKRVIAVGRYSYQKGFDMLVKSWNIVSKEHPDWTLNIFGDGTHGELSELIKELGLEETCLLHPSVKNISEEYYKSSIFALSSRFEGLPMVLLEAIAYGLPPVSFACPCGPKDTILDGENGFLIENENIEALAEKICFLIENDTIRKQMGQKARNKSEDFRMENISKQWKNLFETLLVESKRDQLI